MAIKSKQKQIQVHVDPISFLADLAVLSGNAAQTYNKDSDEYEPDRAVVPLLLMPYANVHDPEEEKTMSGPQVITGVEWYEGAPKADGSNRIVDNEFYKISDIGAPAFSLKSKKNVDPNTPIEIHAIFTFTDKRTNREVKVERSKTLYTALYDSKNYSLKLNQPKQFTIDPVRLTTNLDEKWLIPITAQLYSGKEPVADTNAAYFWQMMDNGLWRDINPAEEFFIDTDKVAGKWPKTIYVDARFITTIAIRCVGTYYDGTYPVSPTNEETSAATAIKVEMPPTLQAEIIQTKGVKQSSTMKTPVGFECKIYDNKTLIEGRDFLFDFVWLCKPSSVLPDIEIGRGRTIEFTPAKLGLTATSLASVRCKVLLYKGFYALTDSDGAYLTDSDGTFLVAYEHS